MQKNHAKRTALALFLLFAVTVSAQAAKIAEVIPICLLYTSRCV